MEETRLLDDVMKIYHGEERYKTKQKNEISRIMEEFDKGNYSEEELKFLLETAKMKLENSIYNQENSLSIIALIFSPVALVMSLLTLIAENNELNSCKFEIFLIIAMVLITIICFIYTSYGIYLCGIRARENDNLLNNRIIALEFSLHKKKNTD